MKCINTVFFLVFFAFVSQTTLGQSADSTQSVSTFSGSVGITNNGFSIVPTFSLNSPATIMNFYWRKNRFSFDRCGEPS